MDGGTQVPRAGRKIGSLLEAYPVPLFHLLEFGCGSSRTYRTFDPAVVYDLWIATGSRNASGHSEVRPGEKIPVGQRGESPR